MINDIVALVVAALISVPGSNVVVYDETVAETPLANFQVAVDAVDREFRGVWVTTVINLDFPSRPGLSNAEIMREIDTIVSHTSSLGLNAIILQVRPAGDAIYPSAIFPWSKYLTGEQGLPPTDGFDPLAYWIEQSHAHGIELHAWINPYRVTHSTSRIIDVNLLHPTNPARLRPDLVVPHPVNTALYLDPGFPDAQQLIIDGVVELLRNYPTLDGIHFDDYFYPHRDFDDSRSFALHGAGRDRHQWRVDNVNSMIYGVRQAINEINPNVRFGISPTGIWANRNSHPQGSDTRGFQHYLDISADSLHWIREGWIDYIIPQLYWHIGFDIADYAILLRWWENQVRGTDVGLHIGHAAWREFEGQANFDGEILRQLQMNEGSDVVSGSVFFRWSNLHGSVGETVRNWYAARPQGINRPQQPQWNREPLLTMNELKVVMPSRTEVHTTVDAQGFNIWGSSIPHLPLYMNGERINNRTPEGFFAVFAPLTDEENIFEFTQPNIPPVTRTVIRGAPAAPAAPPQAAAPAQPPADREYTEPYNATVTAEVAWLFPNPSTAGGTNWLLERGMRDRIVASVRDGQWLKLSNGGWIESQHVNRELAGSITENVLGVAEFYRDGHVETVSWPVSGVMGSGTAPAARAVFENDILTVFFGMQTEIPMFPENIPPAGSIFGGLGAGFTDDGIPYVTFSAASGYRINGFDITISNNRLQLIVSTPRPLYPSWRTPFNGFSFMIDPGHGGTDHGALGPMGILRSEKHINLEKSLKLAELLERMGANVILLRDTNDAEMSVRERVSASRAARPDMFISMHANSVAETTDATGIRGFTVWYRNETSHHAASVMLDHLHYINPDTNRWSNVNRANFYVCRPTWTPSLLFEASFMSNIDDFAWMIDPVNQARMADATVTALIAYFMGGVV